MTRAIDRLIVSGSIDAEDAARHADRLGARAARVRRGARRGRRRRSSWSAAARRSSCGSTGAARPVEAEEAVVDAEPGQLSLFAELPAAPAPRGYVLPELVPVPAPPIHRVRRLSYSALALFERCSYRYYAERVAGLRERRGVVARRGGLAATEIGDAVHRLLEVVDLGAPTSARRRRSCATWYPAVAEEELERIGAFVEAYCESELARRIAALAGVRPERPFAFEHDGVLLHGRLDVLHRDGAARARPRLQDEPARRAHAGRDRRGRLPRAAARVRARVLPRRGRGGRGRLRVPRAAGRGRVDDVRAAGRAGARGRAVGGDRRGSTRASSSRRRASSRAWAARRSTSSAPGRGCAGGGVPDWHEAAVSA